MRKRKVLAALIMGGLTSALFGGHGQCSGKQQFCNRNNHVK